MRILMVTNTFRPHVGGVANSVDSFASGLRTFGNKVLVIAPEFEGAEYEEGVVRVPAIQRFNGTDFSVRVPIPLFLTPMLNNFRPEIVHSHHPFLLGDAAYRIAVGRRIPLVFTHHTMFEHYTHYVPGDSMLLKQFVIELTTGYSNMCAFVVAPSWSIAETIRGRGVVRPIEAIPTGIDIDRFATGSGEAFRAKLGVPPGAQLVGHVGRLAPEKNLEYLAEGVLAAMRLDHRLGFLLVGEGDSLADVRVRFELAGQGERLYTPGKLTGQQLIDAYQAMDVFAFSSLSETQGMVLAEAMAAGVPVVALDAPGVREVVRNGVNGYLLRCDAERDEFGAMLNRLLSAPEPERSGFRERARETAEDFSQERCSKRLELVYEAALEEFHYYESLEPHNWLDAVRRIEGEMELLRAKFSAAGSAVREWLTEGSRHVREAE